MGTDAHSCLVLFSTLIALTAEAFPANRRIMPSPLFKQQRPTVLFYPHRKLSRPWLLKLQEELWKDGPSGDGPGEDAWSTLLPSSESHAVGFESDSHYKTYSPSAEDFLTDVTPFPTVIDTMMDESSLFFNGDYISRTSLPYEGPSSLLNSFIFRPSLPPFASPSSIATPILEESSVGIDFKHPSSLFEESSSVWKMSPRQAISETISDHFIIITAISATHIFSEIEGVSLTIPIPSTIPSQVQSGESSRSAKTINEFEVSSLVGSRTIRTLPVFSSDESQSHVSTFPFTSSSQLFDYYHSSGYFHPALVSQILSNSSEIYVDLKTVFYSDIWNRTTDLPYILSYNYSSTLSFDLLPPDSASSVNTQLHADKTHTIVSGFSMSTQVFYDFINSSFYTFTTPPPLTSFLTRNVLATVTIVESESNTERFIMPSLTEQESSRTTAAKFPETDFNSAEGTVFPHISSSFTDISDTIPVISLWPLDSGISSVENLISREETKTFFRESSPSVVSARPHRRSGPGFVETRPIPTSSHLFDDEIMNGNYNSFAEPTKLEMTSKDVDKQITPFFSQNLEHTYSPTSEQTLTFRTSGNIPTVASGRESWMNEIEINQSRQSSENPSDEIFLSHVRSPHKTESFTTWDMKSSIKEFPGSLSLMGSLTATHRSLQQEMTPTIPFTPEIMSTNDETSNGKGILSQMQLGSTTEFIDPSTHHVTVRSLGGDGSVTDIVDSMQLNDATDVFDSVISESAPYTLLSSPFMWSKISDRVTKPVEKTISPDGMYSKEHTSPTTLESSFLEYEQINITMPPKSTTLYDALDSLLSYAFEAITMSPRQPMKDEIDDSLSRNEFRISPSFPVESYHQLTYSSHTIGSEMKHSDEQFNGDNETHTTITLKTSETVDKEIQVSLLTKITVPEMTLSLLQNTLLFEDSQIQPPPSSYFSEIDYQEIITKDYFSSKTVIPRDQSYIRQLYSSAYSDLIIEPSRAFPHRSGLEDTVTAYTSYELSDSVSVNEYLKPFQSTDGEVMIQPSMIFPPFSDNMETEQRTFSYSSSTRLVTETLYPGTKLSYESMMFSPKDYISENLLYSSNIETSQPETYSISYLPSPTPVWEASKHTDYSMSKFGESGTASGDIGTLFEEASYGLPAISPSAISEHFSSEILSSLFDFQTDNESYKINSSYYSDRKLVPSYRELISSYMGTTLSLNNTMFLSASPFPTILFPEMSSLPIIPTDYTSATAEGGISSLIPSSLWGSIFGSPTFIPVPSSKHDFYSHDSEQTPSHAITREDSGWIEDLQSKTYSRYLESSMSLSPIPTSEDETGSYKPIPELTPSGTIRMYETTSLIDELSQRWGLSHLESTVTSWKDQPTLHYHSKEQTPIRPTMMSDDFSSRSRLHPEHHSTHSQMSSRLISDFVQEGSSQLFRSQHSPSPIVAVQSESKWITGGELHPDIHSSYPESILHSTTGFISEKEVTFSTSELTPSPSISIHVETAWSSQRPEGGLLSKPVSGIETAEEKGTSSHKYIQELTPSPSFVVTGGLSCDIISCPVVSEIMTPHAHTTLMKESDLTVTASSMFHSRISSEQKIYKDSSSTINSSFLAHWDTKILESRDSSKIIDHQSVELVHPTRKPESKSLESSYPTWKSEPKSVTSDLLTQNPEPKSVDSDHPTQIPGLRSVDSVYPTRKLESKIAESYLLTKKPEPESVDSDYPTRTPQPKSAETTHINQKSELKSIDSAPPSRKPESKSLDSSYSVKIPHPIDSDHPKQTFVPFTKPVSLTSTLRSFQPLPATSFPVPTSAVVSSPMPKATSSVQTTTSTSSETKVTTAWTKESSTPGFDIEIGSVLAISSFMGANGTRNATSPALENDGVSESDWSKTEVKPTPSMDLMLFKDNNYWILTVLETPVRGQLPENFSQMLEQRLANAYSEAFRSRSPKQAPEEPVVVKILSLTNDLLLSQLDIVYVVERGGALVPASTASEFLNFLRHEQLREFLGLYAILKAKPYRPEESAESVPVSNAIPVVTIVCSTLAFLLLIFCCFCIYCRCCRPKQDDRTPTSSASGSLQRSLAKHGQHNRKHLFQEMTHHLTAELAAHRKMQQQESGVPDSYVSEKEPLPPGKQLPPLPSTDAAEAIDKAIKMLKVLENKDATTSPIAPKRPESREKPTEDKSAKILPKPKKRKKIKESQEESPPQKTDREIIESEKRPLHPVPKETDDKGATLESPDSGTSSRHTTSSTSEKMSEELGSDSSNTELLPPLQDLIAKSKADSEAAAADTQVHLSRVRQRISELLDDAFALANGRKFNGSVRSKKIDPATDMFPRYSSLRSQSAAECSTTRLPITPAAKQRCYKGRLKQTQQKYEQIKNKDRERHEDSLVGEKRRPISEGAQHLLGAITDDGQLITRPPPKLVWDHNEPEDSTSDLIRHPEVTEAHNRHVNFFPFQQQSKLRQISASSTSSLPVLDTLEESQVDPAVESTISTNNTVLREAAAEVYLAHSSKIHPAAVDQYDEIDVVSALRDGEPVADLIQAIKDELQKFSGSTPGTNNNESNA